MLIDYRIRLDYFIYIKIKRPFASNAQANGHIHNYEVKTLWEISIYNHELSKNKSNSSWPHPKLSNSPPKEVILKCLFYHTYFFYHIFFPPTHYKQRGFGSCAVKVGLGSTCLCIFFGEGRARIQDTNVFVLLLTAGISGIVLKERILNRQCRALVHKHLVVLKLKRDPQLWELSTPSTLTASPIQGATGSLRESIQNL